MTGPHSWTDPSHSPVYAVLDGHELIALFNNLRARARVDHAPAGGHRPWHSAQCEGLHRRGKARLARAAAGVDQPRKSAAPVLPDSRTPDVAEPGSATVPQSGVSTVRKSQPSVDTGSRVPLVTDSQYPTVRKPRRPEVPEFVTTEVGERHDENPCYCWAERRRR
jgi:hypothetical protein